MTVSVGNIDTANPICTVNPDGSCVVRTDTLHVVFDTVDDLVAYAEGIVRQLEAINQRHKQEQAA